MRKPSLEDPDLPIADIMRWWPETMPAFIARGMVCVGCPIGPFHTVEDACAEYGVDADTMMAELRAAVTSSAAKSAQADAAEQR